MILQKFIEQKQNELIQSGKYKNVSLYSAHDILLKNNSSSENFIQISSNLQSEIEEVLTDQSNLGVEEQSGTQIVFKVLENRKRNYSSVYVNVIHK